MNRKFALSFLSILAIIAGAFFINVTTAKAASTTLVISQAYGGGGGATGTYQFDYVELKNISNSPQSLNGLQLMYGSSGGQFGSSAQNIFALPNVTLNPGQYFLVQLSAAGTGGSAFPVTPDATTTNLSMSGTNGKVALVTAAFTGNTCGATATPCTLPNANIIDLVSWGTANNAEGNAPTNGGASLTATQGNVRKGGGCTDTDNNNADFDIITAPVPRNTSTTTPCGAVVNTQHVIDFNGDGKSDFSVVRNTGGGATGQVTWFINLGGTATTYASAWGIATDFFTPVDFDGDNKTDIAVWRPISSEQPSGNAFFYILQSSNNTVRIEDFGQSGDDPSVVDDYNGDGKADLAVYRPGANAGQQSTWFYRTTANGPVNYVPWGQNGDFPAPGDYDGDGKADFVIQRSNGGNQARFWMLQTTAGFESVVFGTPADVIVPGDYDGDGKTDIATIRAIGGSIVWFLRASSTGAISQTAWGNSATDFVTHADYDGDGKTDYAIWRGGATPGAGAFWVLGSTSGAYSVPFGSTGDYPIANYNRH